jgi:hypothetical protein
MGETRSLPSGVGSWRITKFGVGLSGDTQPKEVGPLKQPRVATNDSHLKALVVDATVSRRREGEGATFFRPFGERNASRVSSVR